MRPYRSWVVASMAIVSILAARDSRGAAAGEAAWSVRVWQSDGLPDRHVNGMAQTEDGFLWLVTSYHVARFDGARFTAFPLRAISPRAVRAFAPGRDSLWVVMNAGPLAHLQPGAAPAILRGLPERTAESMVEDGEGAVWIAYREGDLARVRNGQVTLFDRRSGLAETGAISLARDTAGRLWYTQAGQLGRFEGDRFRTEVRVPTGVTRLAAARDGGLWISAGSRLLRYRGGGALVESGRLPAAHETARISTLLESPDGALWIGTRHDGLFRLDAKGTANVPTSHPAIRCLLHDREGNLWVGTGGGGLNRVQPRVLEVEGASTGFSSRLLQSVAQLPGGELWGATRNGILVRRVDGRWEPADLGASLGAATCVRADAAGALWIGTRSKRVHRFERGRLTTWGPDQGLSAQTTCVLLPSAAGDVWIVGEAPVHAQGRTSLRSVLQRLRDGRLDKIALPPNARRAFALAEDARGGLWIGGAHGMLLRVDGESATEAAGASRAVEKQIRALQATPDGSLWIGYDDGGGLGHVKDGRFAHLGPEQGVPWSIAQITVDTAGALWLATDAGLFRLTRADLDAVLEGRSPRVQPVDIPAGDGSFTISAGECGLSGALAARDGSLWMPTGTALLIAHPSRRPAEAPPPRAVVTRVTVDGRVRAAYPGLLDRLDAETPAVVLPATGPLPLRPGDRRLDVEFTSPAFRAPEDVRFRYRLDGLDESWVEAGRERTARYARLPAGEYDFHVSACGPEGSCSQSPAGLRIAVAPVFWQTWGFRGAAATAFTVALVAGVRYVSFRRLRRRLLAVQEQAALDRERTRIARDIHDDVGNRLNRITLLSELALRNGAERGPIHEQVREIASSVRDVIGALDEVVWAVSPRHDTLPHLVSRLGQFASEYLRAAGLRGRLDLPDHPPDWPLSAEFRHNVLCAVKEALTNAVRHGAPQEVTVRISVADDSFTVLVRDDGRGFDPAALAPADGADGLRNMRQRMDEVGGSLEVASAAGAGTEVRLSLPRPRAFRPSGPAV